ncbi:MAG: hypothetical protein C0498_05640 [Anaerolinea sp.]|nr:hypothetical protein [Anaerolinea sp.]
MDVNRTDQRSLRTRRPDRIAGPGGPILTTVVIVLWFAVAGCGGGSGASPEAPPPSDIATGVTAPPAPEPTPTPEPSPTPEPPSPCDGPRPIATPRPTDDPRITGLLRFLGTTGTPGVLGSFTFDGSGSDSPWLPFAAGRTVSIPPGEPVTIGFGDGSAIGGWSVSLADANDRAGLELIGHGYRENDLPPIDLIRLEPLPAGCWVMAAMLSRADGRGSGVTYWSVSVAP